MNNSDFCTFRVHCTNLFEETVVQKQHLETLLSNPENVSDETVSYTNDTFYNLNTLFVTSGCKQQVCDNCKTLVEDAKAETFTKSTLYCIQAREQIKYVKYTFCRKLA